jgi:hypothetical protein
VESSAPARRNRNDLPPVEAEINYRQTRTLERPVPNNWSLYETQSDSMSRDGTRWNNVDVLDPLLEELSESPAGRRAAWVLKRLMAVASGAGLPVRAELEDQYTRIWLSQVPVTVTFSEAAPLMAAVTSLRMEAARINEVKMVLDLSGGSSVRFRCAVQETAPYRIAFQLFSPAMAPSTHVDRVIERDGRSVHLRDFGGDGPLLLLWHGAGCDATVWEAIVPHLRSFRVIAQDLPGHGNSSLAHFSLAETMVDAQVAVAELDLGEPILVGHSMGGWAALHYAATNPCRALVCLDGPASLEYADMGLRPDHHAFVPDPPDVPVDLGSLRSPAMIVLCRGSSPREEEWMVPFRAGLSEHLAMNHPQVRVEWRSAGHMLVLSQAEQTANLVSQFALDLTAG